ncbi:MAG: hypothetical protein H6716_28215 [Polyangiaceae bacterium]|nr:hypothetical protein [Polyangiaceae bacterium]
MSRARHPRSTPAKAAQERLVVVIEWTLDGEPIDALPDLELAPAVEAHVAAWVAAEAREQRAGG